MDSTSEPQVVKTEENESSITQLLQEEQQAEIKQEDSNMDDTPATSSLPPVKSPATPEQQQLQQDGSIIFPPATTPITTFEEIQKQLKSTLDHVEQRNMVSGFQTLSKATGAVVDNCEQLGKLYMIYMSIY